MEYTMTHKSLHIVSILEFLSEFLSQHLFLTSKEMRNASSI